MTSASQTPEESAEFHSLVARAQVEQRAGRFAEAAATYRKIVALRPDVAEAYNSLGNMLASQGKLDEAAAQYQHAVALNPTLFQTFNNLGNILREQGQLDQAMAHYRQALAVRSDYAPAIVNLGNILAAQGRFDEAAARYQQAIALRPDLAEGYNNLGSVLERQGKLDEAAAQFERALALRPDHADACFNLGNVLRAQGRLDQAVARYQQAVALRPDHAEAYNNLGSVFKEQGQLDDAIDRYRRAVALKPGLFHTHLNLARIFQQQGRLDEAAASYQQAIAVAPPLAQPSALSEPTADLEADLYQAHDSLGRIFHEQRKFDQAVASLQRARELRPERAETHQALGNALMELNRPDEAQPAYEQAIKLDPNLEQSHRGLGCIFQGRGKIDQAAACFRRAVAAYPQFAEAYHNLGNALTQLGNFDEAAACYDQAVALKPDFAEVYFHRSELKTFRSGDPDLATLEAIAAAPDGLPADKMFFIHFALGKALEDVGDYSRAFEQWLKANALRRRQIDYNEIACQTMFRQIVELFDAELFDRLAAVGDPSTAPVFIVGMPRSGSTLVEQILAGHPQIHAAGELNDLELLVRKVKDAEGRAIAFPQCVSALDADGFRRLGEAYLAGLPTLGEGEIRITDKALGNFFRIGMIRLILPNARIVHTMRDPVDTCVSCFSRFFNTVPFSYDLAELGGYYRWYRELMDHWRSVLPADAMLDVSYEEVVDDLEQQARRLIDYCGLPWDDRCLSFHENSRAVFTSSSVQVRRPLYRSSLARWRRYESYLQPLLAELESCRQ
ncbi:MAG TPA: tetratricopeptide repeat protein [Pirellulales bacterium]|jgi:tetratricopeptide (TPR) repeat protein|nr:tetratricopeptide repeat protein [Pirellulales bacterium]